MTTLGGRDVGAREYLGSSDSTGYMILAPISIYPRPEMGEALCRYNHT